MRSLILVAALFLSGCASTISSKVTTFNEWSAAPAGKTYQFEAAGKDGPSLEWRGYQNMVRNELAHLGLSEAMAGAPDLRVSLGIKVYDQAYQLVYDPFYHPGRFGPWYPAWRSPFYRYGPYYSPFYMGAFADDVRHLYKRELHVSIVDARDGRRLWEATVRNEDPSSDNLEILPAMIHSAFTGFPGPNGGTRNIDIVEEKK
ncbi:DUF4136 domain-containing protein [Massilia sp. TS11]|uniref:DUF4136 domain-containing protein n=1 Tax=Massilia sp. TS11 TaxID=2908003 RepID=UPI001EDA7755|nr:DUF4136 domain-containing protein [Massilia sp. TS11]MCG2583657.1 DUF4136 domain-containing protein [Massilia sp. TS11]